MRRDLAVAQIEMGDVLFAQDNVVDALNAYPAALELSDRFADANPENAEWQRDLCWPLNRIGDLLRAQGNLTAALRAYSASIAITERLTKADRERAGRQPPVTVSTVRSINDPYLHRGDALGARNIFEKGLKVCDRLVAYSGDAEP